MPILEVHLFDGSYPAEQHTALLTTMSARYAEILASPIDRVRAYLTLHRPEHWATVGVLAATDPVPAPYSTAIMLAGRPADQRHQLLAAFTDILVDVLGVDRGLVRGRIIQVDPDDWGIAGTPAAAARRDEIAARAAATRASARRAPRTGPCPEPRPTARPPSAAPPACSRSRWREP